MGIGIITNPIVVGYALLVALNEAGIINVDLFKISIVIMIIYSLLTILSLHT